MRLLKQSKKGQLCYQTLQIQMITHCNLTRKITLHFIRGLILQADDSRNQKSVSLQIITTLITTIHANGEKIGSLRASYQFLNRSENWFR